MNKKKLIEKYCLEENLSTYDPFDIWKTKTGQVVRKIYYYNKWLGLFPAGILTFFDFYLNNNLRLFYKKQEYPVVRAFAAMILLNLYEKEKKDIYLDYARRHLNWLTQNYSKGFSGYAWGINFDLRVSKEVFYPSGTPFITNTPYVLESFVSFIKKERNNRYIEILKSIYDFIEKDLKVMHETESELALSYAPQKDRVVMNASSYAMFSYALLLDFFPEKKDYITGKITKLYNFIKNNQNKDGSWYYHPIQEDSFIDCFHSSLVVKNLIKTGKRVELENIDDVIQSGYKYIVKAFYDSSTGLYKRFSVKNKPNIVKYDLYDNAEVLNLFYLLGEKAKAEKLNNIIIKYFFNNEDIFSVIDFFGLKKNKNTLRWAVMPYLYTLSQR